MADDAMVVNFDISPDAFTVVTPKIKSRRWKDRLKAKRAVEHRRIQYRTNHPSYRFQTRITAVKPRSGNEKPKQKPAPQAVKTGEFVSFLWAGNPKAASAVTGDKREEGAANEPWNAPLADGSATFTTLGLSPILADHLTIKLSLKAPTAIQRSAIPKLMSTDSDAFIQAETGSGNIDLFTTNSEPDHESLRTPSSVQQDGENVAKRTRHSGLYTIVLAPTRELCQQISAVLSTLIH